MKGIFSLMLGSLFLVACGGGGGNSGGGQQLATVNDDNFEGVAAATAEVSAAIVLAGDLPTLEFPIGVIIEEVSWLEVLMDRARETTENLVKFPPLVPLGVIVSDIQDGDCGGNVTITYDDEASFGEPGTIEFLFEFEDYCLEEAEGLNTFVHNGYMQYSEVYDEEGDLISFFGEYDVDVVISFDGETEFYGEVGSYTCSYIDEVSDCTFVISEGTYYSEGGDDTYRVGDISLTLDEDGYGLDAIVTTDEYGAFEVIGMNLDTSDFESFDSGTLEVTDSSGAVVILIEFVNSTEYEVTYKGMTSTYLQ